MSDIVRALREVLSDPALRPARPRGFGAELRPTAGPVAGHSVIGFRPGRDLGLQELLLRRHDAYVDCLRLGGLRVPRSVLRLIDDAGTRRLVLVREVVPGMRALPDLIRGADAGGATGLLDRVAGDIAEFWRRTAQRPERIGLQARIEGIAMDAGGPLVLDTFPPLISYDRAEVGRLIGRFAERGLLRGLDRLLPGRRREMQAPWYSPAGSVAMLVEDALGLRPQDREAILDWARGFAGRRLQGPGRDALLDVLGRQTRRPLAGSGRWSVAGMGRVRSDV